MRMYCPWTTKNTGRKSSPIWMLRRRRPKTTSANRRWISGKQQKPPTEPGRLNQTLREAERALLLAEGLPNRPWFRHAIYAPGQYTGYAAVVVPGVNEAIDRHDVDRTREQISALAAALNRATKVLESYR